MEEALRFFNNYEEIVYILLGALAIWEVRKFVLAWEEVRGAAFGLERESAQTRLNSAAILLVLILMMAIAEFVLVSFVVPAVPGAMPLLTPTIDLLATPTITLQPSTPGAETTGTAATPFPVIAEALEGSGCIPGQLVITSPKQGEQISDRVVLTGTVDLPNLGHYEYEVAHPGDPVWLTLQAGRGLKREEALGELNTRTLPPGDTLLRLVATDNEGKVIGTCTIQIYILPPKE
ncbi:MAG: hypothetical protein EHM70_05620 [Chloroflexota bacterium]|nr:MAG: hypothetical protein EHM70_05620 [Chloroflexota bacterium]